MKFWTSLKMGHVGLLTKSLGQMFEKSYACSRGHNFSPKIMKLDQQVCFDKMWHKFENESCRDKNWFTWSNIRKKPCVHSRGHIFCPIIMKLGQNVCHDKVSDKIENWSCWV